MMTFTMDSETGVGDTLVVVVVWLISPSSHMPNTSLMRREERKGCLIVGVLKTLFFCCCRIPII